MLGDFLVNPGAIPKFDAEIEHVDHGEVLHADLVILQVLEDEADDADNFFARPEIENLGNVLDHVELEVLEDAEGLRVVAEDPEAAADIVGDLSVALAR